MNTIEEHFKALAEQWFLTEPALFAIYCAHKLEKNPNIKSYLRVGKGIIEYNPEKIATLGNHVLEEKVRIEMIRLLLKHPYERRLEYCSGMKLLAASDMVLSPYYTFKYHALITPETFGLPDKKHYEWYQKHIPDTIDNDSSALYESAINNMNNPNKELQKNTNQEYNISDSHKEATTEPIPLSINNEDSTYFEDANDHTALWEDNEEMQDTINNLIQNIKDWRTLSGQLSEMIVANSHVNTDYRKILKSFRASIISSRKQLTRMKPNRRYGFEQMGHKTEFTTRLLVAVDTSGSVSTQMLQMFYGIINKIFKYGIPYIDVVQFDYEIHGNISTLKKAQTQIHVHGGGGTSFQPVIDFAYKEKKKYDGIIFLTDGYASPPLIPTYFNCKIIWICNNKENYETHNKWMQSCGKACYIDLE